MTKLYFNNDLNGIEISFESKPNAATLEALKNAGFRWHNVKKVWYAKQTPDRVALAQSLTGEAPAEAPAANFAPVAPCYNLDNLGVGSLKHGAELAAAIREDLKKRGVNGVTVRARRVTYDTGITLTIKATAADFVSIEEGAQRFTYGDFLTVVNRWNGLYINNKYITVSDLDNMTEEEKDATRREYIKGSIKKYNQFYYRFDSSRANNWELTTAFYEKCRAAYLIANQWNYDNSDSMTDYFDVGYYLDIDIKKVDDFEPREEMTEADRTTLEKEREEEARKEAEARRKYEEERKAAEEERAKYKAWERDATDKIYKNIVVEELNEENALYYTELAGGIGKESDFEELRERIAEDPRPTQGAEITRKIIFTDAAALDNFNKLYIHDFDFLANKGGTATEDIRLTGGDLFREFSKLTQEQRETIETYNADCVAVYLNDVLKLVINPQCYNYARYVYLPTENTEERNAAEEKARQKAKSENKPAFYIPAPIEEQAEAIQAGQPITIYQCDGWLLNSIYAGAGIVESVTTGNYAQHNGIYITLDNRGKKSRVFIRNNNECLIYSGILPTLPDHVTGRQISATMRELFNYNVLLPNTYNYYKSCGKLPILDTCPR